MKTRAERSSPKRNMFDVSANRISAMALWKKIQLPDKVNPAVRPA